MITSRFITFFFMFIMVSFITIGAINSNLKDKKFLSFLGCMLSLMAIVAICFFPFPYQDELLESMISGNEGLTNNFIPFRTIVSIFKDTIVYHAYNTLCYQFFGNIVLFMPLGFSLFYYLKEKRKFIRALCCIIFITFLVEAEQGLFNSMLQVNYRSVDIDDVMLNTLGGILGFCFALFVVPKLKNSFKHTQSF